MRKIGLVGGTGPESTLMYYKELNSRIDAMTGGKAMPDIAIESVNFRRAWDYVSSGDYDALADYLSEKVLCLEKTGSEIIALTAVTMHAVSDQIEAKTGVSLLSIPKAVCREALNGIDVVVPDPADRQLVARRIYEELEQGIVKESTLKEINEVIDRMKIRDGIEAVVLGCTELPLLLNDRNCVLPCLDSVAIHICELIQAANIT